MPEKCLPCALSAIQHAGSCPAPAPSMCHVAYRPCPLKPSRQHMCVSRHHCMTSSPHHPTLNQTRCIPHPLQPARHLLGNSKIKHRGVVALRSWCKCPAPCCAAAAPVSKTAAGTCIHLNKKAAQVMHRSMGAPGMLRTTAAPSCSKRGGPRQLVQVSCSSPKSQPCGQQNNKTTTGSRTRPWWYLAAGASVLDLNAQHPSPPQPAQQQEPHAPWHGGTGQLVQVSCNLDPPLFVPAPAWGTGHAVPDSSSSPSCVSTWHRAAGASVLVLPTKPTLRSTHQQIHSCTGAWGHRAACACVLQFFILCWPCRMPCRECRLLPQQHHLQQRPHASWRGGAGQLVQVSCNSSSTTPWPCPCLIGSPARCRSSISRNSGLMHPGMVVPGS